MVQAPVPVSGAIMTTGTEPIASADIRAFAIITDGAGERSVPIARCTTDEEGRFILLLPPSLDGL